MIITQNEMNLICKYLEKTNASVSRIERQSDDEFDLIISGERIEKGLREPVRFSAWLPLGAIRDLTQWTRKEIANMTSYPEMVLEGDWSGVRDSSKDQQWAIFEKFVLKRGGF